MSCLCYFQTMEDQTIFNEDTCFDSQAASSNPNHVEINVEHGDGEDDIEGFVEILENAPKTIAQGSDASGSKSGKKLTSEAWKYFELVMVNGVQKARCKYCKVNLSYKGANGTSHLLKHARNTCPRKHLKLASGQTQLKIKTESDGSTSLSVKEKEKVVMFDQEFSRRELVSMVVIHEYPLAIVDHIGFRRFICVA